MAGGVERKVEESHEVKTGRARIGFFGVKSV